MHTVWVPLLLWPLTLPGFASIDPSPLRKQLGEYELCDTAGQPHQLKEWADHRLLVVVFLGTECPLAQLYTPRLNELANEFQARGVAFVGVNANQSDSLARITAYVKDYALRFPLLKDEGNLLADRLGALRTPEVFLLDHEQVVRYRGRIDDQYEPGVHRPMAMRRDLGCAIEDLLAGQPVRVPHTSAPGCFIGRVTRPARSGKLTYCRDIAAILQKRCVACHRPGQIGPFSLTSYPKVVAHAETIREVLEQERMPPWHANPRYGRFRNDAHLPPEERELISTWIREGLVEGDRKDLPASSAYTDGWRIPEPDLVLAMPKPFTVPAEGIVDYQYFEVDPGFTEDRWIQAAEMRPGNRSVVHHGLIFLRPPGCNQLIKAGKLGSVWLTGVSPGSDPLLLPAGMAKRVPAGWKLVFQLHYTTTGIEQTDQTRLGLVFADPHMVRHEVATNMVADFNLWIPPGVADYRVESRYEIPQNVWLLSMHPHMHLRGKSFRYEACYPDGAQEILLDVPRYDFNWQTSYQLVEPKVLPKGTIIQCTAYFDNSINNPANPNPNVVVAWGDQSFDEMMIGYLDLALIDQPPSRELAGTTAFQRGIQRLFQPLVVCVLLALGAVVLVFNRVYQSQRRTHDILGSRPE